MKKKALFASVLVWVCLGHAFAYSIFSIDHPIGEIFWSALGQSRGMAGVSAGIYGPYNLSLVNPANASALDEHSFSTVFLQEFTEMSDSSDKHATLSSTNIPAATFVYPLKRIGAISAAYQQISNMDYGFHFPKGNFAQQYLRATGSRYLGQVGFSRKWLPWLWGGLVFKRSAGNLKLSQVIDYIDENKRDRRDTLALSTAGNHVSVGLTFRYKRATLGLVMSQPINSTVEESKRTTVGNNKNVFQNTTRIDETMPASYTGGVGIQLTRQVLIGADVSTTLWQNYSRTGYTKALENDLYAALGAEWTYNSSSEFSWIERVPIRTGVFYRKWPNQDGIREVGGTLGVGLPMAKRTGIFDVGFEYSRRGNLDTIGVLENSYKISLGFTGGSRAKRVKND